MAGQGAEKGIFDQLAEYLVQSPPRGGEAEHGAVVATDVKDAPMTDRPEEKAADPFEKGGQTFVFAETAEKLVVEKEVVVREELVVRMLRPGSSEPPPAVEAERAEPTQAERAREPEAIAAVPQPAPQPDTIAAAPESAEEPPLLEAPAPVPLLEDSSPSAQTPAEPALAVPVAPEPVAAEPVTVEAEPVEPVTVDATSVSPRAAEPAAVEAAPEPVEVETVRVEPAPAQPPAQPAPEPPQPVFVFGGKPEGGIEPAPRRPQPAAAPAPAARSRAADKGDRSRLWMAWLAVLFVLAGAVAFYFGQMLGSLYTGS